MAFQNKKALIITILPGRLTKSWSTKCKKITVGDLMFLGGWGTQSTKKASKGRVRVLALSDLETISKALQSYTGTTYVEGIPCCCTCV